MALEFAANTIKLQAIGQEMMILKTKLVTQTEAFYRDVNENISKEDNGKAVWVGEKAGKFVDNVNLVKPKFEKAAENTEVIAQNILDQTDSIWTFERM